MQLDMYGELHPVIDEEACKHCNLCVKACPNNNELKFNYPSACYASWITDKAKRKICASGGMGTILSEYVIRNLHGVVFGSRYNENLTPVMTYTESLEELEHFKGSRYVQSVMGENTMKEVRDFLKRGRVVLFIGTPCQVAGLQTFLHKKYKTLYTVDLICHGVCPTAYFIDEIGEISRQEGLKNLSDVRFRGNDGNNFCLTFWSDKSSLMYKRRGMESYYLSGFLLGVSMRENCYSCSYARPERISDITIGDFIGLERISLSTIRKPMSLR